MEKKLILHLHPLLWLMDRHACQDKQLDPNPQLHEVGHTSALEDLGSSLSSEAGLSNRVFAQHNGVFHGDTLKLLQWFLIREVY